MLIPSAKLFHPPFQAALTVLQASESGFDVTMSSSMNINEHPSPSPPMTALSKNLNIYWVSATALAVWFLFIHSPPLLRARNAFQDAPFLWHLIGAYSIYLACIHNTLVTPSVKQSTHVWVGRMGMVLGVIGFVFGLYCSWWPWRDPLPPLGFSIGITIGGVAQMLLQVVGYGAIRRFQTLRDQLETIGEGHETPLLIDQRQVERQKKEALTMHIDSMVSLFLVACGTPAALRIAPSLGIDGAWAILLTVGIFSVASHFYLKTFTARMEQD